MRLFGYDISKKAKSKERVPVKDTNMGAFNQINSVYNPKNAYQTNTLVYSVVKYLLREVVKAEFYLCEVKGSKHIEVENHPILDLIRKPNPVNGKVELLEKVFGYKFTQGESFLYLPSPLNGVNKGIPMEIWCIAPNQVKIESDQYGIPVNYKMGFSDTNSVNADPSQVIHLKYFNPDPNSLRGLNPLVTSALSVQQSQLAYQNNIANLDKGGIQGLFVYNSDNEFDDFDEVQQSQLEEKWAKKNQEKSIMVTNAKLKWEQVGLKSSDLALLDTIKYSLRDICNIYGISSQLMNDPDNKTYSNLKEARIEMISNIVIPEIELFLSELNSKVLTKYSERDGKEYVLKMNKDIYPELREAQLKLVEALSKSYWLTGNEKREALDYGKLEVDELNEIYIPNNLTPIELAGIDENRVFNNGTRQA